MPVLTFDQAQKALQLLGEGKDAEMFEFLTSTLCINPYTGEQSKIFVKGFSKGFGAAHEIIELFLRKLEENREEEEEVNA